MSDHTVREQQLFDAASAFGDVADELNETRIAMNDAYDEFERLAEKVRELENAHREAQDRLRLVAGMFALERRLKAKAEQEQEQENEL